MIDREKLVAWIRALDMPMKTYRQLKGAIESGQFDTAQSVADGNNGADSRELLKEALRILHDAEIGLADRKWETELVGFKAKAEAYLAKGEKK
jgi:hypothetical protein